MSDTPKGVDNLLAADGVSRIVVPEALGVGGNGAGPELDGDRADPFSRGTVRACDLPAAEEPPRTWFGVYRRSVTLLIGETGVGKSSLLYNIGIYGARNEPLWRVGFGLGRPLNVLHIDPENAGNWAEGHGGICALRLERINQGKPRGLIFHDGQGVNLSNAQHVSALAQYIEQERVDLCIVDPIANLFRTEDENDNAEAAKQMKALNWLSRRTHAAVVPCHHLGKDASGNYGRGASARLAAADVGIVLRARGNTEDVDDDYNGETRQREDVCRLQIIKNRWEGKGSLFLRMTGNDQFERVAFDDWRATGGQARAPSKPERCVEEIRLLLMDGHEHSRPEIAEEMSREGFGRNSVDEALTVLETQPDIRRRPGPKNVSLYSIRVLGAQNPNADENSVSLFPETLRKQGNRETEIDSGNAPADTADTEDEQW